MAEDVLKEISVLDSSKAIQATDIPVKVIKDSSNFFAEQISAHFNESITAKKVSHLLKKILMENLIFCALFVKVYKSNFKYSLTISYQSFSAVFEKGMTRKTPYQ